MTFHVGQKVVCIDEVEKAAGIIKRSKAAIEYMEKYAWFRGREPDPASFSIDFNLSYGRNEKGCTDFVALLDAVCFEYKSKMIADATQLAFRRIREAAHVIGEYSKTVLNEPEQGA